MQALDSYGSELSGIAVDRREKGRCETSAKQDICRGRATLYRLC